MDSALKKPRTVQGKLGVHFVEGVAFTSLPAIATEYGMSTDAVFKRYSRGCRGDDLVPLKKRKAYVAPPAQTPSFVAGGVQYKNAVDACKQLNVLYVTYRKRLKRGLSVEQALGIALAPDGRALNEGGGGKHRQPVEIVVNGKTYHSYSALAAAHGLAASVVRQRIAVYDWSPERAVSSEEGKGRKEKVNGVTYSSRTQLAKAFGIDFTTLMARLSNEWTLEEAVGLQRRPSSTVVQYGDVTYGSMLELATAVGIGAPTLQARINKGKTLAEAIKAGKRIANSGRYNATLLQRDPVLANKPAHVYLIRMSINGGERYKIGITTGSVTRRLKPLGYPYTPIKTVSGTLLECFNREQQIIVALKDKRDDAITPAMLDGYSEVFELNDADVASVVAMMG